MQPSNLSVIPFRHVVTSLLLAFIPFCLLSQEEHASTPSLVFNQKPATVSVFGSLGGGDYPFGGLGLKFQRQVFNDSWRAGLSVEYIGSTTDDLQPGPDPVQIFPVMADLRHRFTSTGSGRFSTHLGLQAGFVLSITQNGQDDYGPYQYRDGWALMPVVSFKYNLFKDAGVFADFGWLHHRHKRDWTGTGIQTKAKTYNVAVIRGGIFF